MDRRDTHAAARPRMPETLYAEIVARAARFYDVTRVVRTAQPGAPTPAP